MPRRGIPEYGHVSTASKGGPTTPLTDGGAKTAPLVNLKSPPPRMIDDAAKGAAVVVEPEVDLLEPMELEAEPDGEGEAVNGFGDRELLTSSRSGTRALVF